MENAVGKKMILKNVTWNLLGRFVPLISAIVAIPLLIKSLGIDYFGIFTLVLMVIGYFSLFDLGIGRALTKFISVEIGNGRNEKIPIYAGTGLSIMLMFSMIGLIISLSMSSWMVRHVLIVPLSLQEETIQIFYLLSLSLPIVIFTSGLKGILESFQRFALLNIINIPMGVFNFLAPLAVLPFTNGLLPIVVVLVVGRILGLLVLIISCYRVISVPLRLYGIQKNLIVPMLRFGGWMTVTAIIGPLMVYADRFLISSVITIAVLAYYTTPYEMITKLWIIPGSIIRVLFPVFASGYIADKERMSVLYFKSIKYICLLMFPITVIIVTYAEEMLTMWLGSEFADKSYLILQILTIGVLFNSISQVPYTLIQSIGRPDITAKLHLVELPIYLIIVFFMVQYFGILGAAISWTFRIIIDSILLAAYRIKNLPFDGSDNFFTNGYLVLIGSLLILLCSTLLKSFVIKICFIILFIIAFSYLVWKVILTQDEKFHAKIILSSIENQLILWTRKKI